MNKVRVGLVGTGFAGTFHLECLRRIHGVDVEVTAVTSRHEESRRQFGEKHDVEPYPNVESMLDHIDVLDICSPPYVHEEGILAAAEAGKGSICEKPLTGYFGPEDADESYRGNQVPKNEMLEKVLETLRRIASSVREAGVFFGYAENYVYAPSVQKEREIIEKTGAQILRMTGEESHNGSESPVYGIWRFAGGGSLIGKGCHPLGGILYLKQVEGMVRGDEAIRPVSVSARTAELTRLPNYEDKGFIRTDYHDIEDYGFMHVTFEDGTVSDVICSEVLLGGCRDYVEVFANNHRTLCRISPTEIMDTYNPKGEQFEDIYLMEKISSQEGWSNPAPDEHFTMGYRAELQDFMECAARNTEPQSGLDLALDTTATIYAAYLSDSRNGEEVEVPSL